jgi:hypothetical protein
MEENYVTFVQKNKNYPCLNSADLTSENRNRRPNQWGNLRFNAELENKG